MTLVTPSYSPDFPLCRVLNESIQRYWPPGTLHLIIVDRKDERLFRRLEGPFTRVILKQEVLPFKIFGVPFTNKWICGGIYRPVGGWTLQQVVKIGAASLVESEYVVMVDSDVAFIRTLEPDELSTIGGVPRLYRGLCQITSEKTNHLEWYRKACAWLGIRPELPPVDDYVSQLVSWKSSFVRDLLSRIENVSGQPWWRVLVEGRTFSEFLLYGIFVDRVLGAQVAHDEDSRCLSYWKKIPLDSEGAAELVRSVLAEHVAVGIQSNSNTPREIRSRVLADLTRGELNI